MCAVFAVFAPGKDVSRLTYFGLHALQHRGQESAGIAVADGKTVTIVKNLGLVTEAFKESDLTTLKGFAAIGHVRYSTYASASNAWEAAQPHLSWIGSGTTKESIALAHNGSLLGSKTVHDQLHAQGVRFMSATDSEVAAQLIGRITEETHSLRDGIAQAMHSFAGAYSMVLTTPSALYAFRDPHGMRPLVLGELPEDAGWVVASETCGLNIVGARYVRDIRPGEILKISEVELESTQGIPAAEKQALCVFEYVYFSRPDSVIEGKSMYKVREAIGKKLSELAPVQADAVISVPDSGTPTAVGYAAESGIPYAEGLIKNRYVGRTFIQPTQELRERGVRLKLNPLVDKIAGKRLIVCDDSIVRGTTSRQIVAMLRDAGATEVHMRVSSPPVVWPCFYGVDTGNQDQLIAAHKTPEEIRDYIGADSLTFIGLEDMIEVIDSCNGQFCTACFDGNYPVEIPAEDAEGKFLCLDC